MKVIRNMYEKPNKEITNVESIIINCEHCDSELEISREDTHIGWLGARFVTCPCCGGETMVDEIEGVTLTKDNLEFPVHFFRTNKNERSVVEVKSDDIVKDIKRAITYYREHKDEWSWYTQHGDTHVGVYRFPEDEEYFIVVSKDFYETCIPFEKEDY